jgi:glycine cleavage system transcriptional repressor
VSELVVTVIGHDRPGIVADVAEVVTRLGANLADSTMTRLGGHFAMTLVCTSPAEASEVQDALAPLTEGGMLLATVRAVQHEDGTAPTGTPYLLTVHGADRLGIVAAVTRVIAGAGGNITDLTTRLTGQLYLLVAEVDLPPGAEDVVAARLAEVSAGLGVEVTLRPNEPDLL